MIFLICAAAAIGCIVVAIMFAKRIGGVAPWLIAAVAAMDILLGLTFKIYRLVTEGSHHVDETYTFLMLFDGLVMYVMGLLVLVACFTLMPRLRR